MIEIDKGIFGIPRTSPIIYLQLKVNLVINLEWGLANFFANDEWDNFDFNANGIEVVRIRMSDIWPPTLDQRRRALNTIRRAKNQGKRIAVGCFSDKDRGGVVLYDYRRRVQNWTHEMAYAEWVKNGRHWWYFWWKSSLQRNLP